MKTVRRPTVEYEYPEEFIKASEYLKLTKQEMASRFRMGIEAPKRVAVPEPPQCLGGYCE
ncbi:MAG: hypothetical protein WCT49_05615 [Candidatus Paceibacterota bacterium]|jgi:hypothetical protein